MADERDRDHDGALERLLDRQAIEDVLVGYATALDTRDWAALEAVYLPDAVAIYDGERFDGLPAIVDICRRSLEPLTSSQHLLGNFAVEVDGDAARSACYLQAMHYRAGIRGLSTWVMAGTYRDRFVRTADGWRIAERDLEIAWTDGNSGVLVLDPEDDRR